MSRGPSHPCIPRMHIWLAFPPEEQRYTRTELVKVLIGLCVSNEERRREAEEDDRTREAAEREGELIAYRTVLRILFLSADDRSLTSRGRTLLELLERCLYR